MDGGSEDSGGREHKMQGEKFEMSLSRTPSGNLIFNFFFFFCLVLGCRGGRDGVGSGG